MDKEVLKREAEEQDAKIRSLPHTTDKLWWELGLRVSIVRDKKLWALIGFRTFGEWLDDALNVSRKTAYDAMKTSEALLKIPSERRMKIPKQNAKLLARMPESKRFSEEWISRAESMKHAAFAQAVEDNKIGAEKAERKVRMVFSFDESAAGVVNRGIDTMKNLGTADSKEESVELLFADYLNSVAEIAPEGVEVGA